MLKKWAKQIGSLRFIDDGRPRAWVLTVGGYVGVFALVIAAWDDAARMSNLIEAQNMILAVTVGPSVGVVATGAIRSWKGTEPKEEDVEDLS